MPLHEFKKVQLQEHFMLITYDSISHLKMLYHWPMALSLNGTTTAHRSALKKASILVWIQL